MRCAIQGAEAFAAGAVIAACPYGPTRPFSQRAWIVGWVQAARRAGRVLPGFVDYDPDAPWPGDD
jgi:alkylated DNA nucleotide flippase Atl1